MEIASRHADRRWRTFWRNRLAVVSLVVFGVIFVVCVASLPWSKAAYNEQELDAARRPPDATSPAGTDLLGRPMWARCVLGGVISLLVGLAAAAISVILGVSWGALAGMIGGRADAAMMRIVDILYGLPYILLVILIKIAFEQPLRSVVGRADRANVIILFLSIGAVSWLTMARVIRGQVLSLKAQPFIEAARASGVGAGGVLVRHLLPNLVGPIIVYATLTVPQAILQESFLSFLGIGIQPPLPSWGNLASEGVSAINNVESFWWLLLFPCGLLSVTLLCLNFIGDGLRDAFDPRTSRG
jgi:oligopeptide transport system permease protein